jgi:hypothetical protein
MSKKLDLVLDGVPEETVQPEPKVSAPVQTSVFPNTALSIVHVGNNYQVVEVKFNMETGDTSAVREISSSHTREEAIEQFKLNVIKNGIFG